MRGTRRGSLGWLSMAAACLVLAGCHGTTILDGATPDGEDGWLDTADDPHVDPPDVTDVPDADLSDPAEEDAACGDGLVACEGECVDTMVDMGNCGGCGIRCEAGHTTEVCTAGACEIVECDDGWYDRNWDPYDGCEYECTRSADEESACDGTCYDGLDNDCDGRVDDCSGGCCPESCNGLDDDCDTLTDEDFDCGPGSPTTCLTVCGSTGTGTCTDTCEFPPPEECTPPAESCNGVDDDCDVLVDEDGCDG